MNASVPDISRSKLSFWLELLCLMLVIALAAYLRLINLEGNPGWYSDEGTLVDIAKNLVHGRWQYLSLNQSTLIVARLPLFVWLLSRLFGWFGAEMITLRYFTAVLGIMATILVYLLVRRVNNDQGRWLGLLSALMLAIYPQAVLYSRLGFSYNLLACLVLLTCLGLWSYLDTGQLGWLVLGCLAVGLGTISDIMMLMFILPALLILSARGWRSVSFGLALMAMPGLIYTAWMIATVPQAFWFDLRYTLSRLGAIPILIQLPVILLNYYYMLVQDVWFMAGVVGLFLVRPLRWRFLLLTMFFLPLVSLGRSTGFAISWEYYLIPIFPFIAIGTASLVWVAAPFVLQTCRAGLQSIWHAWGWSALDAGWLQTRAVALLGSLGLFFIIISPFIISLMFSLQGVQRGLNTRIDPVLVDVENARQAVSYVNKRVESEHLVIASPAIAWLLDSRAADFQHSLAADGVDTIHLPGDIPANRFEFDPRYTEASYIVIDRIWHNWALSNIPEVADMLAVVQNWPLEYRIGEFEVYHNPEK